jgi:oligosaccharyltransferase complex subunit epsilon|eukprot:g4264.t1
MPSSKVSKSTSDASFAQVVQAFRKGYNGRTSNKQRLIDRFLVFLLAVGTIQCVYCAISGAYPFNAFLGSVFCSFGLFACTLSLRMQTDAANKKQFLGKTEQQAFLEYAFACAILFVACFMFMY